MAMQSELHAKLTKEDLQYINTVERILNEKCSALKAATDMERLGYTNVSGQYYLPLMRADSFKDVLKETFWQEMDRVNSLSMNKDRIKGASGKLLIVRLSDVLKRHVSQVAMYHSLAIPVDNFNRLFNLNVDDSQRGAVTVKSELNDGKKGFYKLTADYLQQLISDIQGRTVDRNSAWFNEVIGRARSGYAKSALAGNVKVLLTQTSSLIAAGSILDQSSIIKGMAIPGTSKDVVKYCDLAKHRRTDNTLVKAQGVFDKVGKVGDVLMKPIGWMDDWVVNRLFGACQVQVAKDGGAKIGTEENKVAAGKLLERVIIETQQNSLTTERSAAMRSSGELLKSLTMFSADSMKTFGRFMDALGERAVIGLMLKEEGLSAEERIDLESRKKKANKQLRKATAVITSQAVFMALLGLAFRAFYRKLKDKETDEIVLDTVADAVGNLIGGLPIWRDIYSYFSDGYEVDIFAFSVLNETLGSIEKAFSVGFAAASGEVVSKQAVSTAIRDVIYSASQLFGIPTRNAFNLFSGITGLFSESQGYYIDDLFYKQPYQKDLKKAIENEDEKMISTITGLMMDETVGAENTEVRSVMKRLTVERAKVTGDDKTIASVLPRSLGDTITYEGEEIDLDAKQKNRFRKIYSVSDTAVASLVKLQTFQNADAEAQSKAIRFIYDTYYNLAVDDLMSIDSESKNVLFAQAIDIEKLAIIIAAARSIKADRDRSGKEISGSRKKKVTAYVSKLRLTAVEKYMIMGYLGYSNVQGKEQVKSYINKLDLSKNEKKKLLEYSGYKEE